MEQLPKDWNARADACGDGETFRVCVMGEGQHVANEGIGLGEEKGHALDNKSVRLTVDELDCEEKEEKKQNAPGDRRNKTQEPNEK